MPYSKVQYFEIQTPRFVEFFPDCALYLMFASGFSAKLSFIRIINRHTVRV